MPERICSRINAPTSQCQLHNLMCAAPECYAPQDESELKIPEPFDVYIKSALELLMKKRYDDMTLGEREDVELVLNRFGVDYEMK